VRRIKKISSGVAIFVIIFISMHVYQIYNNQLLKYKYPFISYIFINVDEYLVKNKLKQNPYSAYWHYRLGQIYHFSGRMKSFIEEMDLAARLDPNIYLKPLDAATKSVMNKNYKLSIYYFEEAIILDKQERQRAIIHFELGTIYENLALETTDITKKEDFLRKALNEYKISFELFENNRFDPSAIQGKDWVKTFLKEKLK